MRKLFRITVWSLGAIFILMALLFIYLRNADLSVYEEQIEGFLTDAVGHKLDVDGLFVLRFGRHTHLTAEQIRLSNPDWTADPEIASVGHLSVTVDIWSLISGPIIVEDLDIRDIVLRLDKDDQGKANWATGRTRDESEPGGEFERGRIAFREVEIQNVRFDLLDPARRRPLNVVLEQLTVMPDENQILDLHLTAVVNEIPVWADGKLGPWENLIDGNNVIADLDMTLGQVRVALDGSADNLPKLVGTELTLDVSGPAIERITDRLGLPPFAEGAFEIDARIIKLDAGSQLSLDGNLGAIELFAAGTADSLLEFNTAQLDFRFSGPNTRYVAEVFGIEGATAVPFLITGDLTKEEKRLSFSGSRANLGENTLGFDGWLDFESRLPDGDLVLSASGPDFSVVGPFVRLPGMPAAEFDIRGRLQKTGNDVRFDDVQAMVGENRILANGAIGGEDNADAQINFSATGPDISILGPITGLSGIQPRPFDISAVIKPDPAGIRIEGAKGDFGEIQIEVDGILGTARGLTGTDLIARATGSDLRYIALLAGVPYLPGGPFEVGARARIEGRELRLSEGAAEVGGLGGTASGVVSLSGDGFGLDLSVSGGDLAEAMELEWLGRMSGEAFALQGRLDHAAGRLGLESVRATVGDLDFAVDGHLTLADLTGAIRFNASAPDAVQLEKLVGVAQLPEGPFSVNGRIEKKEHDIEFADVMANIGENSLTIDGTLSTSPMSNRSDLRFSGSGPDLLEIGRIFEYEDLPAKPFSLSGEVNGIPTGFAVEKVVARIGDNDITGAFKANLSGKPEVTGGLTSSFVDLRRRLVREDSEQQEAKPATGEYVFSDQPINAEWLEAANIDIAIETDRLMLGFGDVHDFSISIKLWDGVLAVDPVSFRETDGSVSGNLRLGPENGAYALEASMNMDNMHIGLLGARDQDRSTVPAAYGQLALSGSGRSLHELMASSNGRLTITQGSGRLKDLITSRLFGDLVLQIIRTLNPLQQAQEYTNLDCGIYTVNVVDGLATIENLAIQTDRMAFVARGNINLKDEKLNLTVNASPREGLGISIGGVANSFLKLGGTLKSPKLQIDPKASVTTTGAAVATGGLSLLAKGLWDRVKGQSDICEGLTIGDPAE
jgi:uncharacterized protein involved in outer membrane biogenesis